MAAVSGSDAQPFNLDAILSEFNVGSTESAHPLPHDDAVARVRASFGLGRSIFRRKESSPPSQQAGEQAPGKSHEDVNAMDLMQPDGEDVPRALKPTRRIVDTDDEDDLPLTKPRRPPSSPALSITKSPAKPSHTGDSDSEDEFSTEKFLEDYRKARADALAKLNARAAATAQEQQPGTDDEVSVVSEQTQSPARSYTRSASPSARKTKTRKASKKALEDMHRETQRMARNMALRPEVKVAKKIDMNTIFAKFGFDPTQVTDEKAAPPKDLGAESLDEVAEQVIATNKNDEPPEVAAKSPTPIRFATPNLDDSDSDESLPSPSKLASYLTQMPAKPSTPPAPATKLPSPRKVHFTLPPSPSTSDEDSDVEILPPPNLLHTHATTPDRKKIKRTALIRSLAGVKSPGQMKKSPGRMTAKELDATLSREAAVQAKRKRDERRAELKSLGIDLEKIAEKRDLLEEAREEARRVRKEEAGDHESDDEEYFDEEAEDDGDDEDSGDDGGEETVDDDDEMPDSTDEAENEEEHDQDEVIQDVPPKRKGRKLQITSDDEEELPRSQDTVPESTLRSHDASRSSADDLSLTQFFRPTQMSAAQQSPPVPESQTQGKGDVTGSTQFFQSTAMEDDVMKLDEGTAHGQMELLRQHAGQTHTSLQQIPPSFPTLITDTVRSHPRTRSPSPSVESPTPRRILKRRAKPKLRSIIDETPEEFRQSRKEFIQEQAEESEDDYKAWGSGDESENENMDAVVEGLIDDETKIKKNSEEVARLYMEVERERDEKFVQGLIHDLQNGGLRKRRGGNLDFGDWDSDDDDEDAEERRRRWELRREEMKRRILEDENLGKLAANPKTQAFVNAISSSTLNVDDEPDFLGEDEIIEDRKASVAARNLPHSISRGDSQSQSQDQLLSPEVQVPATSSANLRSTGREHRIIEELIQVEDSQPGHISLSEDDESEEEEDSQLSFVSDKVYTGFIDRAAQKRASRTASESTNRFAFKAVSNSSPARVKRTAVSVIEADDESTRKKIMKEVVGSKTVKRKAWGAVRGRGAVTFRASGGRGKENSSADPKHKKDNPDAEKRRKDILTLMDSQNSFC